MPCPELKFCSPLWPCFLNCLCPHNFDETILGLSSSFGRMQQQELVGTSFYSKFFFFSEMPLLPYICVVDLHFLYKMNVQRIGIFKGDV